MNFDEKINPKPPSPWVVRYAERVPEGPVLDLACGGGRNGRYFLSAGRRVTFLDRDVSGLADLSANKSAAIMAYDLESGLPWPFSEAQFSGIIVVNYLYRPLLRHLSHSLSTGGLLIYQTFAQGNEKYGRPRNPEFLLAPDELLNTFGATMEVIDFQQGFMPEPDRIVQSLCAVKI